MAEPEATRVRGALLSVSDRAGLVPFASALAARGVRLVATGGTARALEEAGLRVTEVARLTGSGEFLDGRVKTLHPAIHGAILARDTPGHRRELADRGIEPLDLVVVNLYPFERTVASGDVPEAEAVEQIDIGGPALIRAAAKNHERVAVVVDPARYGALLEEMRARDGAVGAALRRGLALEAFRRTAAYDAAIAEWLGRTEPADAWPRRLAQVWEHARSLRYGENPHQEAALYLDPGAAPWRVVGGEGGEGKALSYNNLVDADAAWALVEEWGRPAAAVVKHASPCGAAIGADAPIAFHRAWGGDPMSAYGGVVALNRPLDLEVARVLAAPERFLEVVIAPSVEPSVPGWIADRVRWGRNLRVMEAGEAPPDAARTVLRRVRCGVLVQRADLPRGDPPWRVVTRRAPTEAEASELRFAWRVAKHVRSNAVVLAAGEALVGAGGGLASRLDAVEVAVRKAGARARGACLASDGFFPFADGVELAATSGVTALIQPGGSRRDAEVVEAADRHGLAMVHTGVRHFLH
ncbi:MAG: bifunctional phosphoribosylaminoimidazolecarboxamide formyltransferase/IMP cyclohydrolase [Planctomycetes bacterium]|nr:bifunctional phosphoribosylaminoimidazolecarboxamide formyltransferase/IMP cyclohydrolase [Planctomycetota bacterium]